MLVSFAVSKVTSCKPLMLSCFFINAKNKAPTAPTPAASVIVATPPMIDPRTASIKKRGGNRTKKSFWNNANPFSFDGLPGGILEGLKKETHTI